MDNKNLQDYASAISFVIVILFLFFAFFLLTVKTKNKTRNRLLASYLMITAIDISAFFYYRYITLPPEVEMFRYRCLSFLKSPLFFLFVFSLVYTDFRLKPKYLLHLLPFFVAVLVLLPGFFIASAIKQEYFFSHHNEMWELNFLRILDTLQSLFYMAALIVMLRKYKTLLFENYASNISLSNYRWLSQLINVNIFLNALTMSKDLIKLTPYADLSNKLTLIMLLAGVGFIFWIVLNALYFPDLFRGIDSKLQPVEKLVADAVADHDTSNNSTTIKNKEKIGQLKSYMVEHSPYIEPSLTVQELANQMKMPVRDLSILINHHLNQHFFDFVNEYRIKKATEILRDPAQSDLTVLEILYQVGFNSKSSFHTAFKKQTDLTPTQYRKAHTESAR